jgi:hypothetical protein
MPQRCAEKKSLCPVRFSTDLLVQAGPNYRAGVLKEAPVLRRDLVALLVALVLTLVACGGSGGGVPIVTPPVSVTAQISGATSPMNAGSTRTFTATVSNTSNTAVTWSVVEQNGGTITSAGVYTAPSLPGTFTVKAVPVANTSVSATIAVSVVIPVGHIAGYDVGVDYHAYGTDFQHTHFIKIYNQAGVRDTVKAQLQGMADRGATTIRTCSWFVTEPGTTDFGESWRLTFPMTDQEVANLRTYVQDVAAVKGSGGNRLRLDVCFSWLGAADYTQGSPEVGLGYLHLSPTTFTARVEKITDDVLGAVADVKRPDGVTVVDTMYMESEVMIGAKANKAGFMLTHYPRFVTKVTQAGLKSSVTFISVENQAEFLDDFTDPEYPILNNHRSQYWNYRSLKWMVSNSLPVPLRIDFSWYVADPPGADWAAILARTLNDADAVLPSLGAPQKYGIAETHYFLDATQRRAHGQAIAGQAAANSRLQRMSFWTTPDGGGAGINVAYPFAIEDFYPPAP